MIRLLIVVFILQIYVGSTKSQNIDHISAILNYYLQMGDMIYDEGGLMVTGDIVDSTLLLGYFIGRLNSNEEMRCFKHYIDSGRVKQLVFAPILKVNDNFFIAMGFAWQKSRLMLVAFNSNCDTIFTKEYKVQPNDSLDYQVINAMIHIPDSGYVLVGSVRAYQTWDSLRSQSFVMRLDEDFNMLWQTQYGDHFHEMSIKADYLSNDTLLVFGMRYISKYPELFSPWERSLLFTKVSLSTGKILWQKLNEKELRSTTFDFVKSPDNTYILNSSRLVERYYAGGQPGNLFSRNSVFKLDSDYNYEWEVYYGEKTITPFNHSWDIVASNENDGLISVGSVIDTSNDKGYIKAITKINWAGDSIWTRYYQPYHINPKVSHSGGGGDDKIVATDDGYIIGLNIFFDTLSSEYPYVQQLWFLEIDQFGCHIPGCHLQVSSSDINYSDQFEYQMMVYPNPSSNVVNVLIKSNLPAHSNLRLYDNLGKEVFIIKELESKINYVLNVSELPAGIYLGIIEHQGNVLAQSRLVINR